MGKNGVVKKCEQKTAINMHKDDRVESYFERLKMQN